MKNILNFIFSKKDEGIYRTYRIFGIKIITKPIKLKLDMIESIMFDIKNYTLNKLNNDYTRYCNILSDIILYKDKPKIFYLQTPEHCNIGDLAIAYFSRKFLSDIFPNNIILEYTYNDILGANNLIQKFINSKDSKKPSVRDLKTVLFSYRNSLEKGYNSNELLPTKNKRVPTEIAKKYKNFNK